MKKIFLILALLVSVLAYSQVIPLPGNIEPGDQRDSYYMLDDLFVRGGFTVVKTIDLRNDIDGLLNPTGITESRRDTGMICYVVNEGKFYQLIGGIQNSNWIEKDFGNFELYLRSYQFDTLRLVNNNTKIWQLRLSNDTLYYNGDIFIQGGGSGGDLPLIDADRPINFVSNGTNIAAQLGRTNVRLDSLVEAVFYAALPPGASLTGTGDTYIEYGSTNNITLSWTATKTTNPITSIIVAGESITPTGNTQSGTKDVTIPSNTNTTYNLEVTESTNLTANASKSYYYMNRLYVGIEASGPVPDDPWYDNITDADILNYPYSDLKSSYSGAGLMYSISNPDGARVVVVAPTSFGTPKIWLQGGTPELAGALTLVRTWDFVNQYGYVTEYKMYVSGNKQNMNPLNFYLDEN